MHQCIKRDVCQAKGSQGILSGQYIPTSYLTLDFLISILKGVIYSSGYTSAPSLIFIQQRSLKILSDQYIPISRLTLDLLTLKWIWAIGSLECFTVPSLISVYSKYWVVSIFICPDWPLTFDLKISRVHLLYKIYPVFFFYPLVLVPVPFQLGKIASKLDKSGICYHCICNLI
jgi:hypothetical protein